MGWQTREHWRHGVSHLWLEEQWDVYSAGWRVRWNGPARYEQQAHCNGRHEQPPDPDRHAAREILARRELARRKAAVAGEWEQIV